MKRRASSTTVVVAGSVAQRIGRPGHAWVFAQYVLGLRRLGHDVVFVDRIDDNMCTDEIGVAHPITELVRWSVTTMDEFGIDEFALRLDGGRAWVGLGERELRARMKGAILLDVMGFLGDDPVVDGAAARIFVDLDPGFTQLWDHLGLHRVPRDYDRYITVGTAIGGDDCLVPSDGIDWRPSLPPVVLDRWPALEGESARATSVGAWRGLTEPVDWDGRRLGVRAHAFRQFAALPTAAGGEFEICLAAHPDDRADVEQLRSGGWTVLDPGSTVGTLCDYRSYIGGSGLELCVAKQLHTELRTGWFSDRSACYLASGRPVAALDTGVVGLPEGDGFVTFDDLDSAVASVAELRSDPQRHGAAARALAEAHLDSDLVLRDWLAGVPA